MNNSIDLDLPGFRKYVLEGKYSEAVSEEAQHRSVTIKSYTGYTQFSCSASKTPRSGGGVRQAITSFTQRARSSLLKRIFSFEKSPRFFFTLTYPKFYPADAREWKKQLDVFGTYLQRIFPGAWFVWKLEPQHRGAPHFHLIGDIPGNGTIAFLRIVVAELWYNIVDSGDPLHLKAGTSVEYIPMESGKMQSYVSKYVGKKMDELPPAWARPGRFWGAIGRKNMPGTPSMTYQMSVREWRMAKRLVVLWVKSRMIASKHPRRAKKFISRLKAMTSFYLLMPFELCSEILQYFKPLTFIELSDPPF